MGIRDSDRSLYSPFTVRVGFSFDEILGRLGICLLYTSRWV
ncbi:hypothetical protein [Erwinia amylovora]